MARIRSIHPGAPSDEDVATMSWQARLTWAYLPCHADREGRLKDAPFTLKLAILPTDDVDMGLVLDELQAKRLIVRYEVDGRRFIWIRNFARYQTPHVRETASIIPPPPSEPLPRQTLAMPGPGKTVASTPDPVPDPVPDPGPERIALPARVRDPLSGEPKTAAAPDVVPIGRPKLWTAGDWLAEFGRAWTWKYHLTHGGGQATSKACAAFGDVLAALPEPERLDAQARAEALFTAYFGDPSGNAARHPFYWFVDRFDGLRVKLPPPAPRCWFHQKPRTNGKPNPRGPDDTCVECRHVRAAGGDRSSEPMSAGAALPTFTPPAAWTPEQIAEAAALRAGTTGPARTATGGGS